MNAGKFDHSYLESISGMHSQEPPSLLDLDKILFSISLFPQMLRRGRMLILPLISGHKKQSFSTRRNHPSALIPAESESISSLLSDPSLLLNPVDDLLKPHAKSITSELVLGVLNDYRKLGRARTLAFFSWAGNRLNYRFDDAVVEYMADYLGRRKLFDDLKCLLLAIHSRNGRVSSRAISICIRFLGRSGRVSDALSLFETMESELNCPPDNAVFNNVLYMLCRLDHSENSIDVALSFFRKIGCPDEYSYSNIVLGLCKSGRIDIAHKMFNEMLQANLVPTKTAANFLVGELCKLSFKKTEKVQVKNFRRPFDIMVPPHYTDNSINSIVKITLELRRRGFPLRSFIINHLISELTNSGMIDEAVQILKTASSEKPALFQASYNAVIIYLCKMRRMAEAVEFLQMMFSVGLLPKASTYTSIISAFCKLGDIDEAQRYFELMNKKRCEPDNGAYTALVRAYCSMQRWELAYDLVMEMMGLGMMPSPETRLLVENLLRDKGRTDLMVKLGVTMEGLLLEKLCVDGQKEAAYEKLMALSGRGILLPPYMIERLELAFRGSKWSSSVHQLLSNSS